MTVYSAWTSTYLKTDEDRLWFDEGLRSGYRLRRPPAPLRLRGREFRVGQWWGIRHLRAYIHMVRVMQWDARYEALGLKGSGQEAWMVHAIWKGWQ